MKRSFIRCSSKYTNQAHYNSELSKEIKKDSTHWNKTDLKDAASSCQFEIARTLLKAKLSQEDICLCLPPIKIRGAEQDTSACPNYYADVKRYLEIAPNPHTAVSMNELKVYSVKKGHKHIF